MRDHLGREVLASDWRFARDVLFLDDCQGTFNWEVTSTGEPDIHEYNTVWPLSGVKGLMLQTRSVGQAPGDYVQVARHLSFPESEQLVVRCRLALGTPVRAEYGEVRAVVRNGGREYHGAFSCWPNVPAQRYLDAAGAWQPLPGMGFAIVDGGAYVCEFVLDARTMQYVAMQFGGVRTSLAGVALHDHAASADRGVSLVLRVVTAGAAVASLYAGSFYVGEIGEG